ncbi:unnamed protein product, partial [marine sediment metagenome]
SKKQLNSHKNSLFPSLNSVLIVDVSKNIKNETHKIDLSD